jgi:hypothetical protein
MKAHRRGILAGSVGLALTACAQLHPPEAPARPSAEAVTRTGDDPESRFIGLIGKKARHAPPFLGVPETNFYCLRSFVDRQTGERLHQVYVADSYAGTERRWDAARDADGHSLRFVEISRERITCDNGCSYAEEFAADIPESELRAHPSGLQVIFSAQSGAEKTIGITGGQIAAQIAAVDATPPRQPPPAPPHP